MERLNIHGLEGCNTPTGKRCTACCQIEEVTDTSRSFQKNALEDCKHREACNGCKVYNTSLRPDGCSEWTCQEHIIQKLKTVDHLSLFEGPGNHSLMLDNAHLNLCIKNGETTPEFADKARRWAAQLLVDPNTPPPDYNNG